MKKNEKKVQRTRRNEKMQAGGYEGEGLKEMNEKERKT